jgi:hypothetical protein
VLLAALAACATADMVFGASGAVDLRVAREARHLSGVKQAAAGDLL